MKYLIIDGKKRCAHCKAWIKLTLFGRVTGIKSGRRSWCCQCENEAKRVRMAAKRQEVAA
jgi:hypothetical protein